MDVIDAICGVLLTGLSGLAARVAGADLPLRRKIDEVVRQIRVEIANEANRLADLRGEPLEDDAA